MSDYQKPESFRHAVELMRAAQRGYFKSRTRADLERSKHYEAMVDRWLKRWREEHVKAEPMVQQALLMGGDLAWDMAAQSVISRPVEAANEKDDS